MLEIVAFCGPLAACLLVGTALSGVFRRPFGQTVPLGILCSGLVIYLGTLLSGRLEVGLAAVVCITIGLLVYAFRRDGWRGLRPLLCTPGLLAFALLYLYVFCLQMHRGFTWYDEISHWGPMVKETLRLNTFYTVPESALMIHQDYPPLVPLLEAAWCRLSGGYSEPNVYRCITTVSLSLFLPVFEAVQGSRLAKTVKVVLGCGVVLLGNSVICGDVPFYTSIYLDYIIALLMAYGISQVVLEPQPSAFQAAALTATGSAVLLAKQMGIAFYLMIVGLLLTCYAVELLMQHQGRVALLKKQLTVFVPAAVIPLLLQKSWSLYLKKYDMGGQFELSDVHPDQLLSIWRGADGEAWQQEAAHNFVSAYFGKNIWAAGAGKIELSYWQMTFLFAAALILLTFLCRRVFPLHRLVLTDCVLVGGSGCYALVMLLLYVFSFGSYEGPHLASYTRYMNTYWFGVAAVLLMLALVAVQRLADRAAIALTAAACVVLCGELFWEQRGNLKNLIPFQTSQTETALYGGDAGIINSNTPEDASIFIVDPNSNGYPNFILSYLTLPREISLLNYSVGQPYDENDVWTKDISREEYISYLQGFDYVYFVYVDGQYLTLYGDLYPEAPSAGALYRVTGTDPLQLERIWHD